VRRQQLLRSRRSDVDCRLSDDKDYSK